MKSSISKNESRLQEIFEDLMSRFIINVPESEIATTDRICFQIEQAHWFYEDFIRETEVNLPGYTLKRFAGEMFNRCPLLSDFIVDRDVNTIYKSFVTYKTNVPVCGAIILNDRLDKILLVKGWSARASWTFPKGKINQNESDGNCAIREVMEETGFDISSYLNENLYIEQILRGEQRNRLFIIHGIPESTQFCPQTRKEISDIKWHTINSLPGYRHSNGKINSQNASASTGTKYFMVRSFMPDLQKWLAKNRKKSLSRKSTSASLTIPAAQESQDHATVLKSLLGISPSANADILSAHPTTATLTNQASDQSLLASYPAQHRQHLLDFAKQHPHPPVDHKQQHKASLLSILHGTAASAPDIPPVKPSTAPQKSQRRPSVDQMPPNQQSLLSILNNHQPIEEEDPSSDSHHKTSRNRSQSFSAGDSSSSGPALSDNQQDLLRLLRGESTASNESNEKIMNNKHDLLQLLNGAANAENRSISRQQSSSAQLLKPNSSQVSLNGSSMDIDAKSTTKNTIPSRNGSMEMEVDSPVSPVDKERRPPKNRNGDDFHVHKQLKPSQISPLEQDKSNDAKQQRNPHLKTKTGKKDRRGNTAPSSPPTTNETAPPKVTIRPKMILQRPKGQTLVAQAKTHPEPPPSSTSSTPQSNNGDTPKTHEPTIDAHSEAVTGEHHTMGDFKFNVGDIMKWFVRS